MSKQNKPNIIWISTHDTSAKNLGCYGDKFSHTPNIDSLATNGIRYANAFTAGPICSPSRTSIFTGMHPTTLGTHHHRSAVVRPNYVQLITTILKNAGYTCTKPDTDLNLYISPDEYDDFLDPNEIWDKKHSAAPFFAYFKLGSPHASVFKLEPKDARKERSKLLKENELHDPANAPVPSFIPNTPLFRERYALFYDAVTNMDKEVGGILSKLKENGLMDNTAIVFWGDHGTGYPRGKIHAYDDGLHVPLIIRFPKSHQYLAPTKPGSTVSDLVMHMDLAPTTLRLAGIPKPDHMQGHDLCLTENTLNRDFVCSARDRLDNNPEMTRTIRTISYRYIRNFFPHQPYASFYPDGGFFSAVPPIGTPDRDFWETSQLPGEEKIHDPDGAFLLLGSPNQQGLPSEYQKYLCWQNTKPLEELYDIKNDPEEIHNLASEPSFEKLKNSLREELFNWMIETKDLGLIDEIEIVSRAAPYNGVNHEVGRHCNNFQRILETADLSRLGEKSRNELLNRLKDPDSAVRFWAVTGLSTLKSDKCLTKTLKPALDDESSCVRLAAANQLVGLGRGLMTIPAFSRELKSDILWNRLRAGAYLSYHSKENLKHMKPLLPILITASTNPNIMGSEYEPVSKNNRGRNMLDSQRDVIAKQWVLNRVIRRIKLS